MHTLDRLSCVPEGLLSWLEREFFKFRFRVYSSEGQGQEPQAVPVSSSRLLSEAGAVHAKPCSVLTLYQLYGIAETAAALLPNIGILLVFFFFPLRYSLMHPKLGCEEDLASTSGFTIMPRLCIAGDGTQGFMLAK